MTSYSLLCEDNHLCFIYKKCKSPLTCPLLYSHGGFFYLFNNKFHSSSFLPLCYIICKKWATQSFLHIKKTEFIINENNRGLFILLWGVFKFTFKLLLFSTVKFLDHCFPALTWIILPSKKSFHNILYAFSTSKNTIASFVNMCFSCFIFQT